MLMPFEPDMLLEKSLAVIALLVGCLAGEVTAANVSVISLPSNNGKPAEIAATAFSSDGRLLAVSVPARGLRSGYIGIVDLENRRLVSRNETMSFAALAVSRDSRNLLGVGGMAGVRLVNIESGKSRKLSGSPLVNVSSGTRNTILPIDWTESKGILVVRAIRDRAIAAKVAVGDKLVSFAEGERAVRHDDSREWRVLKPYGRKYVMNELDGLANSWLQLRFARDGEKEPVEVTVQRKSNSQQLNPLPQNADEIAIVELRKAIALYSATTGRVCASVTPRDAGMKGFGAISPDCKFFGWVSKLKGSRKEACVEVFDLATGRIVSSGVMPSIDYKGIDFAPDSKTLLVGTRNTIEVFDIAGENWKAAISLVPPEDRDKGRMVKREARVGLSARGLEARITAYFREFSKPAALCDFDVTASGQIAIGAESGDLILTDLANSSVRHALGEKILKSKPEFVAFDPTGRRCVAYAGGELFIVDVPAAKELSAESP